MSIPFVDLKAQVPTIDHVSNQLVNFLSIDNMFCRFSLGRRSVRQSTFRTSFLGLTFGNSRLLQPQVTSLPARSRLRPLRRNEFHREVGTYDEYFKSKCEPRVINIFLTFPCGCLLLLHLLTESHTTHWTSTKEDFEPRSWTSYDLIPSLPYDSLLSRNLVPIDYAVDQLMKQITQPPTNISRLWLKHLIVSDLSEELAILNTGGRYLCIKELADNMDWERWWRHWCPTHRWYSPLW